MSVFRAKIKCFFYIFPCIVLYFQQQACSCGIHLTFDSWQYLSAARCLINGEALKMADGSPFIAYPSLFPLVLSLFGKNPLEIMPTFLATLYLFNLMLWIYLGQHYIKSQAVYFFLCLSLCLSTPLLLVHSFLWSEALFISFLSIVFLYYHHYPRYFLQAELLLVFVGIGILVWQRNAGVWWGIGILIWLIFFKKHKSRATVLVLSSGIIFLLAWGWYLLSLNPSSFKHEGLLFFWYELGNNLVIFTGHLSSWFMPRSTALLIKVIFGTLLLASLFWVGVNGRNSTPNFIYLLMLCNGVYLGGLLILKTSALHYSDLERFMAVMQPSLLLVIFYVVEHSLQNFTKIQGRFLAYLFYFLMSLSIFYQSSRLVKNTYFLKANQCKQSAIVVEKIKILLQKTTPKQNKAYMSFFG